MKRVLVVTNFSASKKKARLLYEIELLQAAGYDVDVQCFEGRYSLLGALFSYASLKFFNVQQIFNVVGRLRSYQTVLIYGLQPLPIVLFKPKSLRVIYQSLDDNVSYTLYELGKRFFLFKTLRRPLDWLFRKIECWLAKKADAVLVNSLALEAYLPNAKLNYYTSPLENIQFYPKAENPFAILYLGQLRDEKGTEEIRFLCEKSNLVCHFFGIPVDENAKKFAEEEYVIFHGNKTIHQLSTAMDELTKSWNLLGVSLIKNIHHSYATQEANKDIDYMAMGIPFVGNQRITTKAKIDAGCGVFLAEYEKILDFDVYSKASDVCRNVYEASYASSVFKRTFLNALRI